MPEKLTPQSLRCSRVLSELLLGDDSDYRTGVVVLSYRRPGAGDRDVSFAHASGMRTEDGALDFVMMAKTLRKIADQLEHIVAHPEELVEKGTRF